MVLASRNNETISDFAKEAFERFLANNLTPALPEMSNPTNRVYLYCHLLPEGEPSRRLLVMSEPGEAVVRVGIEASYELFKGDMHYHVRRIGSAPRENSEGIEPLLRTAFTELLSWRPTHESIWENVF